VFRSIQVIGTDGIDKVHSNESAYAGWWRKQSRETGLNAGTGNFFEVSAQNRLLRRKRVPARSNSTAISASCGGAKALSCYSAKQAIKAEKQALRSGTSDIWHLVTGDIPERIAHMS
jgi:hypothetical protein